MGEEWEVSACPVDMPRGKTLADYKTLDMTVIGGTFPERIAEHWADSFDSNHAWEPTEFLIQHGSEWRVRVVRKSDGEVFHFLVRGEMKPVYTVEVDAASKWPAEETT